MAKKSKPVKRKAAHAAKALPCMVDCDSWKTLLALLLLFTLMAFAINAQVLVGPSIYWMLVAGAAVFLLVEAYCHIGEPEKIGKALLVGVFLMVFDFAFQNAGWLLGLWRTFGATLAIGAVPIEIMLVCLLGGAAWALYLPRKYDRIYTFVDVIAFAVYGAFGEFTLMGAGLMAYYQWWNSWLAFASYAFVWVLLHYVKYKVVKV